MLPQLQVESPLAKHSSLIFSTMEGICNEVCFLRNNSEGGYTWLNDTTGVQVLKVKTRYRSFLTPMTPPPLRLCLSASQSI